MEVELPTRIGCHATIDVLHLYAKPGGVQITWVIPRTAFYDYLEALVRAGLGKRLMFGSDQMRWPGKIREGIDAIRQARF